MLLAAGKFVQTTCLTHCWDEHRGLNLPKHKFCNNRWEEFSKKDPNERSIRAGLGSLRFGCGCKLPVLGGTCRCNQLVDDRVEFEQQLVLAEVVEKTGSFR